MYFDLEDYHPDISPVGQAISWREGVLLSIIAHLVMVILILVAPRWFPWLTEPRRVQVVARQGPKEPPLQYMMVAPRVERPVAKAPERALPSDLNRAAASPERAKKPENMEPFSRGRSPERVDEPPKQTARGQGPQPDPAAGNPADKAPADQSPKLARLAVVDAAAIGAVADHQTAPTAAPRAPADRSATRCATCSATRRARRSTTRAAAAASSAPRFSSTPRASSSARGFAASSRRSSATGSFPTPRCR